MFIYGLLVVIGQLYYDEGLCQYILSVFGWQMVLLCQIVYIGWGNQFVLFYGEIVYMCWLEMINYVFGDEFIFGFDIWKVFLYYQKGGVIGQCGYVILKEV